MAVAAAAHRAYERTMLEHELARKYGSEGVLTVDLTKDEICLQFGSREPEILQHWCTFGHRFLADLKQSSPQRVEGIRGIKVQFRFINHQKPMDAGALALLLEELLAFPNLQSLRLLLPFHLCSQNSRVWVRTLQQVMLPLSIYKMVLNEDRRGLTLHSGALDIGFHTTHPGSVPSQSRSRQAPTLHDPLVRAFLELPDLISVVWPGCELMADTFQQLTGMSHLVTLHIEDVLMDKFHATTLLQALTPATAMTTSVGKKRKRSSSQTMGTLRALETLRLHDVGMDPEEFVALWTMLGVNQTLTELSLQEVSIRPSFDRESELWGPIFLSLAKNATLQRFTLKTIYGKVPDDGIIAQHNHRAVPNSCWMQLDEMYTQYMMQGLWHVLHSFDNRTLTHIDFGFRPGHPDRIQDLLHLNVLGLRPCWMSGGGGSRPETTVDRDDFVQAILTAVDKDHDNSLVTPDLIPCLYKIFHENPTLVEFLQ